MAGADEKFFEEHIRPLLIDDCIKCHGPDRQEGSLRLDSRDDTEASAKHVVADPKTFWSFQPIREVPPPSVSRPDWGQTPIIAFILAKLEANNFTPAPPADPRTLVRRACFGLLGLPPPPAQVDDFIKDKSSIAWGRLIDNLLQSNQYDERRGRHWLDVARYALSTSTKVLQNKLHFSGSFQAVARLKMSQIRGYLH